MTYVSPCEEMNDVTSDPRVCACAHVQCVHRCLTLWCLCRHRSRGGISSHPLPAQHPEQRENKARSSSCIRWDLCRNTVNIKGIYAPLLPPYGVCFPDAQGGVGMWVISAWGSCCSRADGSSRWVKNARTEPQNSLSSPKLPTPKLPTLLFLAEMLHHNGSNQEEDPRDKPAGQQNNWFHLMIEIKCSYWKWEDDTSWQKIVEARKREDFCHLGLNGGIKAWEQVNQLWIETQRCCRGLQLVFS